MTASKNAAWRLERVARRNSFVLKILAVTRFDSRFCKDEIGSMEANAFVSKILQKGYIKNIFDHSASLPVETLQFPLCVE